MALVVKDRVKVTSTTTGTGTFTLGSAVLGFQDFSVIGDGNTTYYTIVGVGSSEFEVGIGTFTASGTTLSRDTILESSNAGSAVNFSAGAKEVFVTYPAERAIYTDAAGTAITPATASRLSFANLAQGSALSVLGVTGNATADNASIAAGTDNQVLRRSGTSVGFGAVNLASTDAVTGDLPFSNLAQGSALSVLGVTGNATADNASIAAGTDHQVFRRSGTAVGFGAVNLAQAAAITGTLPVGNGGTGITSLGTGVATFLGTPSSANLAAAVTDETGSGSLVFATSPTFVTPLLGTPASGNLANCTFPTLNQNTTGSAATLTTARTINGVSFNGSANITITAAATNVATQLLSLGVGTAASGTTGEIRATNNVTAFFSDKRLKDVVGPIDNALHKVLKISGVYYKQNKLAESFGYNNYEQQVGVIAQEIQEVLPEAVKFAPFDREMKDGNEVSKSGEEYLTVQYEKLVPLLIEAIKELRSEIDALKAK
jgi:hypothetical protein